MNKPRILLPLVLAGLVLAAALATASVASAADNPSKSPPGPTVPQAELDALFDIAPLSGNMRARLASTDPAAALMQAELDAMFAVAPAPVAKAKATGPARDFRSEKGREVYLGLCFACHLPDGKGVANAIPPLAGSDFLLADRDRAIHIVLKGLIGPVKVNGVDYNSAMPPLEAILTEEQVTNVLSYVTGEWGNTGSPYKPEDIRRVKAAAAATKSEVATTAPVIAPAATAPQQ
ncbi:MAG TPA: cytochrome c [Lacunisphaera sp.]|nr:cytochrome c [Lacunisphaera sp.]